MSQIVFDQWGWQHATRPQPAIANFNLTIEPGERVVLLGPSGAGKSTILHGLAGVLGGGEDGTQSGQLTINSQPARAGLGVVGLILQEPEAQVMLARVGYDIAFGAENLGVPPTSIWERVLSCLHTVGLGVGLYHNTSHLSGGQQQRLALARVPAMQPQVLALDEPTANLDPAGSKALVEAVGAHLVEHNTTLVLVDHNIDQWHHILTRVVVLNQSGGVVADGEPSSIFAQEQPALTQSGVWVPGVRPQRFRIQPEPGEPLLNTQSLGVGYAHPPTQQNLNITINAGEITAITGLNGEGKSTLALTLAGLMPALSGKVTAEDRRVGSLSTADPLQWKSADLASRISMVFQQPEYQFVTRSVREELHIGPRTNTAPNPDEVLAQLGMEYLADAHPMSLSGGEKRRLSVATAIVTGAPVVMLMNPPLAKMPMDGLLWPSSSAKPQRLVGLWWRLPTMSF